MLRRTGPIRCGGRALGIPTIRCRVIQTAAKRLALGAALILFPLRGPGKGDSGASIGGMFLLAGRARNRGAGSPGDAPRRRC